MFDVFLCFSQLLLRRSNHLFPLIREHVKITNHKLVQDPDIKHPTICILLSKKLPCLFSIVCWFLVGMGIHQRPAETPLERYGVSTRCHVIPVIPGGGKRWRSAPGRHEWWLGGRSHCASKSCWKRWRVYEASHQTCQTLPNFHAKKCLVALSFFARTDCKCTCIYIYIIFFLQGGTVNVNVHIYIYTLILLKCPNQHIYMYRNAYWCMYMNYICIYWCKMFICNLYIYMYS